MKAAGYILLILAMPSVALGQSVYKCKGASGESTYSDTPCDANNSPAFEVDKDAAAAGGDDLRGIAIEGTSCMINVGYITAAGWVRNLTRDAKSVRLTTTFTHGGAVRSTLTLSYDIAPFRRVAFSHPGGANGATRCEYSASYN